MGNQQFQYLWMRQFPWLWHFTGGCQKTTPHWRWISRPNLPREINLENWCRDDRWMTTLRLPWLSPDQQTKESIVETKRRKEGLAPPGKVQLGNYKTPWVCLKNWGLTPKLWQFDQEQWGWTCRGTGVPPKSSDRQEWNQTMWKW